MSFQGFSPRLWVAIEITKAKKAAAMPADEAEKARRKNVQRARNQRLVAENLEQRALVESRRR